MAISIPSALKKQPISIQDHAAPFKPTTSILEQAERLLTERILMQLYPRLQCFQLPLWKWFNGPLVPSFLTDSSVSRIRRIVEIGCGDGAFTNLMALLFPQIEVIGIDETHNAITDAQATVGQRTNLKFLKAKPTVLAEIPCDRLHYNHCLSKVKSVYGFQKLLTKTASWIVDEGDLIIQESPLTCLFQAGLIQSLLPYLLKTKSLSGALQAILLEIGFQVRSIHYSKGILGFPSQIFVQAYKAPYIYHDIQPFISEDLQPAPKLFQNPNIVLEAERESTQEQSNDRLLSFLFSNAEADLSNVLK